MRYAFFYQFEGISLNEDLLHAPDMNEFSMHVTPEVTVEPYNMWHGLT